VVDYDGMIRISISRGIFVSEVAGLAMLEVDHQK
jgi:hypothetical protein